MDRPHSHCPDCGERLPETDWPRTCATCERTHFLNPTPVALLLQPVGDGLLTVRRDVEPHVGELALPGGFIDHGESWRRAASRELREETGVDVRPSDIEVFAVESAPDGTLLVAGLAPRRSPESVEFETGREVREVTVVASERELAFSLHTEFLSQWLNGGAK